MARAQKAQPERTEDDAGVGLTAYVSSSPVYTGGRYYKPGETFRTAAPKGADWTEVKPD